MYNEEEMRRPAGFREVELGVEMLVHVTVKAQVSVSQYRDLLEEMDANGGTLDLMYDTSSESSSLDAHIDEPLFEEMMRRLKGASEVSSIQVWRMQDLSEDAPFMDVGYIGKRPTGREQLRDLRLLETSAHYHGMKLPGAFLAVRERLEEREEAGDHETPLTREEWRIVDAVQRWLIELEK